MAQLPTPIHPSPSMNRDSLSLPFSSAFPSRYCPSQSVCVTLPPPTPTQTFLLELGDEVLPVPSAFNKSGMVDVGFVRVSDVRQTLQFWETRTCHNADTKHDATPSPFDTSVLVESPNPLHDIEDVSSWLDSPYEENDICDTFIPQLPPVYDQLQDLKSVSALEVGNQSPTASSCLDTSSPSPVHDMEDVSSWLNFLFEESVIFDAFSPQLPPVYELLLDLKSVSPLEVGNPSPTACPRLDSSSPSPVHDMEDVSSGLNFLFEEHDTCDIFSPLFPLVYDQLLDLKSDSSLGDGNQSSSSPSPVHDMEDVSSWLNFLFEEDDVCDTFSPQLPSVYDQLLDLKSVSPLEVRNRSPAATSCLDPSSQYGMMPIESAFASGSASALAVPTSVSRGNDGQISIVSFTDTADHSSRLGPTFTSPLKHCSKLSFGMDTVGTSIVRDIHAVNDEHEGGDHILVLNVKSDVRNLEDGCIWRKYGEKDIKNRKFRRSYFKCAQANCPVRKHIERSSENEDHILVTYKSGQHNHPAIVSKQQQRSNANIHLHGMINFG